MFSTGLCIITVKCNETEKEKRMDFWEIFQFLKCNVNWVLFLGHHRQSWTHCHQCTEWGQPRCNTDWVRVSASTDGGKRRESNSPERWFWLGLGQFLFLDVKSSKQKGKGKGAELAWVQDPLWPQAGLKEPQWLLWQEGRPDESERLSLVWWLTSSSGREDTLKVNMK